MLNKFTILYFVIAFNFLYSFIFIYYFLIKRFLDGGGVRSILGLISVIMFFLYFLKHFRKIQIYKKDALLFYTIFLIIFLYICFSILFGRDLFYIIYESFPLIESLLFLLIGYCFVSINKQKNLFILYILFY